MTQVLGKVVLCKQIFFAVAYFHIQVGARLVGQLREHLGFLSAYHAAIVEQARKRFEVAVLPVVGEKLAAPAKLREPAHNGKLRHQVLRAVYHRRSRK